MLATTAAMDGLDTFPAPGWFTSAPKTIVGAWFREGEEQDPQRQSVDGTKEGREGGEGERGIREKERENQKEGGSNNDSIGAREGGRWSQGDNGRGYVSRDAEDL